MRKLLPLFLLFLVLSGITGCGSEVDPATDPTASLPPATLTWTPTISALPTPESTATPLPAPTTATPSPTVAPTGTPIPVQYTEIPEIQVLVEQLDLLAAPDEAAPVIGIADVNEILTVTGVSENARWYRVACEAFAEAAADHCWVPVDTELVRPYEVRYEAVEPPAGLLYTEIDVGLWWLDENLTPRLQTSRTDLFVAPSGQQGVYFDEEGQLWYVDLLTNERRRLTAGEDLNRNAVWLDETAILTGVYLTPEEMDGPNDGHLARIDVADGALTVLDSARLSFGHPAVSAGGTIAYAAGGSLYLLPAGESEPMPFNPAEFEGWQSEQPAGLLQPAFSPDGDRLAWLAGWGERSAVAVFDLEARTVSEVHVFDPARFGGLPPRPVWSPDGNWIAVRILANGPEGTGLWLLSLDGSEQNLGSNLSDPVWLDGEQVLFSHYRYEGITPIERVIVVSGERRELALSGNLLVIGVADQ